MNEEPKGKPRDEIIALMRDVTSKGGRSYVKWNCEACGERVTCSTPNTFYDGGWRHNGTKKDGSPCWHVSHPALFGILVELPVGGGGGQPPLQGPGQEIFRGDNA